MSCDCDFNCCDECHERNAMRVAAISIAIDDLKKIIEKKKVRGNALLKIRELVVVLEGTK